MNSLDFIYLSEQSLWLVFMLSMTPIVVAAIVGTLVSLIQALTQIQEQTLGFLFKLTSVIVTLLMIADWLGNEIYRFTELIFQRIINL
ncbi:type III secretion system export apparatus subunit SctS [Arsenophonus nasoniae]|uniref:type III secretion system export apparatus subunit SctS n=1 Tax=Arsenophonus nasoniae TaxID=638 RepID=UPI003879E6AC